MKPVPQHTILAELIDILDVCSCFGTEYLAMGALA